MTKCAKCNKEKLALIPLCHRCFVKVREQAKHELLQELINYYDERKDTHWEGFLSWYNVKASESAGKSEHTDDTSQGCAKISEPAPENPRLIDDVFGMPRKRKKECD